MNTMDCASEKKTKYVSMDAVKESIQEFLNDKNVVNLSADEFNSKLDVLEASIIDACSNTTKEFHCFQTMGELVSNEGIALISIIKYCRKARTNQISRDILPIDELNIYKEDFITVKGKVTHYCETVEDATPFFTKEVKNALATFCYEFGEFIEQQETLLEFVPDDEYFQSTYDLYNDLKYLCERYNDVTGDDSF